MNTKLGAYLAIGGGWLIAVLLAGYPSLIIAFSVLYGFALVFVVGRSLKSAGTPPARGAHVRGSSLNFLHIAAIVVVSAGIVGWYSWANLSVVAGRPWLEASLYQMPSLLLGVAVAFGVLGMAESRKAKP